MSDVSGGPETGTRRVGRYELIRQIGRGGMAIVYLARQETLDRDVALKELSSFHAGAPDMAERFLRESRLAGSLNHPNIVTVLEYFEDDGVPYIAMEYVPRGSLRPYVGHLALAQLAGVMEGVLAGLALRGDVRDRPPRPQAREPDGDRRRAREDRGLRDRQGHPERRDRSVPDRDRDDGRDPDLYGARAGDGPGRRRVDRSVLGWGHGLGARGRATAVPGQPGADGDPDAPRQRADPAGVRPDARGQPGPVGLDRPAAGQGRARAHSQPRRRLGGARGDRDLRAGPALAPGCAAAQLHRDARHAQAADPGAVSEHSNPDPEAAGAHP